MLNSAAVMICRECSCQTKASPAAASRRGLHNSLDIMKTSGFRSSLPLYYTAWEIFSKDVLI